MVCQGIDEYVYDVFFTGSSWQNVPSIQANHPNQDSCTTNTSHLLGGVNHNIYITTIQNGSGMLTHRNYAVNKVMGVSSGEVPIYLIPPTFMNTPDEHLKRHLFR